MILRLRALLVKELRSLFASPIAYVVLTAYVALSGVYFFQHLLNYNRVLFLFHGVQEQPGKRRDGLCGQRLVVADHFPGGLGRVASLAHALLASG